VIKACVSNVFRDTELKKALADTYGFVLKHSKYCRYVLYFVANSIISKIILTTYSENAMLSAVGELFSDGEMSITL
jgi:hypothetical protein